MKKVVILGGSYAALKAADQVFKLSKQGEIELTLISASSEAYYNFAAPRLIVQPELAKGVFHSVEKFIKNHSNGHKTLVVIGFATNVDLDKKVVSVGENTYEYDVLVIATGARTLHDAVKVNGTTEATKKALDELSGSVKTAKTIAVVGGGPTGVEITGEIAESRKDAKVTIFTGKKGPLERSSPKLVGPATSQLKALGVEIVNGKRFVSSTEKDGQTVVELDDGSTQLFDLVIPSYSSTPNTDFLPESIKTEQGYVDVDEYLQVKGQPGVFALGDVVDKVSGSAVDIFYYHTPVFGKSYAKSVLGHNVTLKPLKNHAPMIIVPISSKGGVGLIFGFRVPLFFVWLLKARTYGIPGTAFFK